MNRITFFLITNCFLFPFNLWSAIYDSPTKLSSNKQAQDTTSNDLTYQSTPSSKDIEQNNLKKTISAYEESTLVDIAFKKIVDSNTSDEQKEQLKYLGGLLWEPENIRYPSVVLTGSLAMKFWANKFNISSRASKDIDALVSDINDSGNLFPSKFYESYNCLSSHSHTLVANESYYSIDLMNIGHRFGNRFDLLKDESIIPVISPDKLLNIKKDILDEFGTGQSEEKSKTIEDISTLSSIVNAMKKNKNINLTCFEENVQDDDDRDFHDRFGRDDTCNKRRKNHGSFSTSLFFPSF